MIPIDLITFSLGRLAVQKLGRSILNSEHLIFYVHCFTGVITCWELSLESTR